MPTVIELTKVTKNYGSSRGVNNISLKIEQGSIFGFLGPNGAGKSTTINMLVDLTRPSAGSINIFGLDSVKDSLAIRRRIGFLTGDMALDESLTALQQLTYFGRLHGNVSSKRIYDLAKQLDLKLDRKIKTLSRGNRQKVGLVSALMHDPDLLILDEPTTGLDPIIQAQFNQILLDNQKRGKTTLMSSHLLSEVQEVCDHVAFIREGKLLKVEAMSGITSGSPKRVRVVSGDKLLRSKLGKLAGTKLMPVNGEALELTFSGDINKLLDVFAEHPVKDLTIQDADLETVFMGYYQEKSRV